MKSESITEMLCQCGCAKQVKPGNQYIHGHNPARRPIEFDDVATVLDTETGCLLWLGSTNKVSGYGYYRGRPAHRIAFERAYGTIPPGLVIDHVYARGCRHRNCIEPSHLEAVTNQVNIQRAFPADRPRVTQCKRGHGMSGDNVVIRHNRNRKPQRACRECERMHGRLSYHRRRSMAR